MFHIKTNFNVIKFWTLLMIGLIIPATFNSCSKFEVANTDNPESIKQSTNGGVGAGVGDTNEDTSTSSADGWTQTLNFNDGPVNKKVGLDAGGLSVYSNDVSLDGSLCIKMSVPGGETAFGNWGGIVPYVEPLGKGDKIWVQFYIYIPDSFIIQTPGNGSLKFIRLNTFNSSNSNAGFNDLQMIDDDTGQDAVYRYIKEGIASNWTMISTSSRRNELLPRNKWFKVEINASFDNIPVSQGGKSFFRMWVDNELIWNGTDARTLTNSSDVSQALYLFTYWNGSAPKDQSLYIDNLILTSKTPSNKDINGYPYLGNR